MADPMMAADHGKAMMAAHAAVMAKQKPMMPMPVKEKKK